MLFENCVSNPASLFEQLQQEIHWQQGHITLYGKRHLIPRLQAWYGDEDASYRYSGTVLSPRPWTPGLSQLKTELEILSGLRLNAVLCNLYRTGADKMGWHSDNEPELGPNAEIISLSLGACRDFALRQAGSTRQHLTIPLNNGSVLWMKPGMQSRWQHALPARKKITESRINLTFRLVNHGQ